MKALARAWRQSDPLVFLAAIALGVLGWVLVTSASWHYPDRPGLLTNAWVWRHGLFLGLGLLAMATMTAMPPRVLRSVAVLAYAIALGLLVAVTVVGHSLAEQGALAQRWVQIGALQLQPSEPAKLALILVLARVLSPAPPGGARLLLSGLLTAAPVLLVYVQPDLGTALSMVSVWLGMVVMAGTPKRYLVGISVLGLAGMPLLWLSMKEYMRQRVLTFLNPEAQALGEGYNLLQAQISIGSGGMWGKGLFEGTQTQLRYLRLSHSDFIFSVLGEELGFVGAMALFLLLAFLLFRVLRAYDLNETRFGALVCAGFVSLIAFQAVANIGGNMGVSPAVGIPLPFISHGGSALISQFAAVGLVQATLAHRRPYRFEV